MTNEQFQALIAALFRIEHRLPEPAAKPAQVGLDLRTAGQIQALSVLLDVLDGWIQGAKENHEASGHRNESTGEECWTRFGASDIKNMIDDAARELGVRL